MRKKFRNERLPEIVFSSADSYTSQQINRLVKDKVLRKLLPRVYTSNHIEPDEAIIRKNIWMILSHLFPGALLSHRSAIEFGVTTNGNIYLTGKNRRVYKWSGVNIRVVNGPGHLDDDRPLYEKVICFFVRKSDFRKFDVKSDD